MILLVNLLIAGAYSLTISGTSSGACFATQFHVAYSSVVTGAALVAGATYICAEGSMITAATACADPLHINLPQIYSNTEFASSNGYIDNISNLNTAKVWIFSGKLDTVVKPGVVQKTLAFYQHYTTKGTIVSRFDVAAEHAWITNQYGNLCFYLGAPFINDCNLDAAGEILKLFYGPLKPRVSPVDSNLHVFSQGDYGDIFLAGMLSFGFIYVPKYCVENECPIHISFHGCLTSAEFIGELYVLHSGLNNWAESNNFIIIYPQLVSSVVNPQGCWDFWGYTGSNYAYKNGRQMEIVYRISQTPPIVRWVTE